MDQSILPPLGRFLLMVVNSNQSLVACISYDLRMSQITDTLVYKSGAFVHL